jgi:WD40 repeat protein
MEHISIKTLTLSLLFSTLTCLGMKERSLTKQTPTLPHIKLEGHEGEIEKAFFSAKGTYIFSSSAGNSNNLMVWNGKTGELLHNLVDHTEPVLHIASNPQETQLASSGFIKDFDLRIWSVENGKLTHLLKGHNGIIRCINYSSSGRYIASTSDGPDNNLYVWNAADGTVKHNLKGDTLNVAIAQFSPDEKIIMSAPHSIMHIKVWDNNNGTLIKEINLTNNMGAVLNFNTDLSQAISIFPSNTSHTESILMVTSNENNAIQAILLGHTEDICNALFSPSNKKILSMSLEDKDNLMLWANDGEILLHQLIGHSSPVTTGSFSNDEKYIVSGSYRKPNLLVWNTKTGKIDYNLSGHEEKVNTAKFSPNGKYLISGSGYYQSPIGELILWCLDQ